MSSKSNAEFSVNGNVLYYTAQSENDSSKTYAGESLELLSSANIISFNISFKVKPIMNFRKRMLIENLVIH